MKKQKNLISKVEVGSIAEELEIKVGDELVSINGRKIVDIIDYMYMMSDDYLEIVIIKENGEEWILEVDKDFDEELGVEFTNAILDQAKSCSNKCIFCFVDQLPDNMRESLYFKDDDSRLSFLQGNFVTLTNLKEEDLDRIIEYNISPINVSVHTTNPELRVKMLNNRFAGNVMERLEKLVSNRIEVNAQIVLCPGFNDKEELDRTLLDLAKLPENLKSVAIVPIGKTKYRDGLCHVDSFTKESSLEAINRVQKMQKYFLEKRGTRFAFVSDEFFVMADVETPDYEEYEGFELIEDGIGLIRKFEHEILNELELFGGPLGKSTKSVSIITGKSAEKFMGKMCDIIMEKHNNIKLKVLPVTNNFFGEEITVAGLVTATDIIKQYKGKVDTDIATVPKCMLKSDEDVFLDDITVQMLSDELGVTVVPVEVLGKDFLRVISE